MTTGTTPTTHPRPASRLTERGGVLADRAFRLFCLGAGLLVPATLARRTTVTVVLPAAISGITSGALLAIARAAGETAPIIVTAGVVTSTNWNLFADGNTALPAQIYDNASSVFGTAQDRVWGAALTLVAIVLVFTFIARLIANRFAARQR